MCHHSDVVTYREYVVGGKPAELCTVGELAKALNRTSVTIQAWEREGIIPKSGYVKPRQDPSTAVGLRGLIRAVMP